ncbi:MAG: putative Adenylate cyclase [Rhodospirillales bacterium]|nr:putative Adenylate cyclase [Rhodospirillales bacterium]
MSAERQQLEAAIAAFEGQRSSMGDAIVDAALAPMRAKLATLVATEPDVADQALRQVTILFLDVVGSTSLSQHLDPEDVHAVMDGTLSFCTAIVTRHGGRVLQYAGDNLLAVFGADEAREDDAERAVRAGLALLDEGKRQGALVLSRHSQAGFDVRVGLHTGSVLLGGGVDAEGTIRGLAVNIAARMEQTAPPGGLRISHDTYAHVRGVFEVDAQAPIAIKGVDALMLTYLVRGAKARAFRVATRGIEGIETRMIGRDAEFIALQAAFERLFAERRLAAVAVVGEAGLGKSRLIYEFSNWTETRPESFLIFQGRATPQTQDQPYGLLRDIIAWRFQIADGDSMEVAKAKLEAGLIPLYTPEDGTDGAEAHAHLLGFLIGLDYAESRHIKGIREDGKQIRGRAFHAAAELFRRIAQHNDMPIVLQLDDLHWADDASLDFLFYLSQVARQVPMLVVGLTRPTLFERRAEWIGAARHERIDLVPLGKDLSRELTNELLKKLPKIPAALRELVSGGAEGNPFYMEELVKMLIDQGAIETGGEAWRLDGEKLLATKVPGTLTGILQARLDGLPPTERRALQEASVIGLVFWDQALAALDAAAPDALPALARRELALPHAEAALTGMREYAFKHQILHHVTYETVLKRARRDLHARAADWFAGLTDARASEFLGVAARHYAEAGDEAKACDYFTRAAEQARARFAHETTLDLIGEALGRINRIADPSNRARLHWRLLNARERTFDVQGQREAQSADLDRLEALAETLDDQGLQADIAWRRAHRGLRMGDYRAMETAARRSLTLAEAAGDAARCLKARRLVATAIGVLGDPDGGRQLATAGLAEVRALGLRGVEYDFLNTLTVLADRSGDLAGNLAFMQQGLVIGQELGDRRTETITRINLAESMTRMGAFERARAEAQAALTLARALGDRVFECISLIMLSEIALLLSEDAQALDQAAAAMVLAVETQGKEDEMLALLAQGSAELALGRIEAASTSFARALDLASLVGRARQDALAGLMRVALALGDPAAALGHLEPMLAELAAGMTLEGAAEPNLIRLTCWRALDQARDPRAGWMLELVHRDLQATAASITDPDLRDSFLDKHPTHRAIVAAWRAQGG